MVVIVRTRVRSFEMRPGVWTWGVVDPALCISSEGLPHQKRWMRAVDLVRDLTDNYLLQLPPD